MSSASKLSLRWPYLAGTCLLAIPLIIFFAFFLDPIFWVVPKEKSRLANRVDHAVLVAAYDQMLKDGRIDDSIRGGQHFSQEDLPLEFRVLKPHYAYTKDTSFLVEFGGGMHHFGLKILRLPRTNQVLLDGEERQLTDRVVLYDHGG